MGHPSLYRTVLVPAPYLLVYSQRSSYVKDIAKFSKTNSVYFNDVVPLSYATKASAANAFFYVLAMATRDLLKMWVARCGKERKDMLLTWMLTASKRNRTARSGSRSVLDSGYQICEQGPKRSRSFLSLRDTLNG